MKKLLGSHLRETEKPFLQKPLISIHPSGMVYTLLFSEVSGRNGSYLKLHSGLWGYFWHKRCSKCTPYTINTRWCSRKAKSPLDNKELIVLLPPVPQEKIFPMLWYSITTISKYYNATVYKITSCLSHLAFIFKSNNNNSNNFLLEFQF